MKNKKQIATAIGGLMLSALISSSANAEWSIKSLGTFGGIYSYATGINDSGQVVGEYKPDYPLNSMNSFITGANGVGMENLDFFGSKFINASGISNSGQVAGYYDFNDNGNFRAFITGPNGAGVTDLGTLGGIGSYGLDINNSGQVAGESFLPDNRTVHAFITGANGVGMTDLGTLDGKTSSSATGINDSGQVVGSSGNYDGPSHAFITGANGVGMADLGTLDGNTSSYATGINNSGQVVGASGNNHNGTYYHAFITGANGLGMTDLGTMGGDWSGASGINNLGQVIGAAGYYDSYGGSYANAFIYSNGIMVNLSYLDVVIAAGWTDLSVSAINDNGQIVGHGILNGIDQAFMLSGADDEDFYRSYTPFPIPILVPEPSTYAMLLAGLGCLGLWDEGKRRNKEARSL